LTAQHETTTGTTNMALATLTDLIKNMQLSQTENSKNMNTLMNRFGLSTDHRPTEIFQDNQEETIELSFETDNTSIIQTPEKMQTKHRYNTRSSAKMEVDNYFDKENKCKNQDNHGNIHSAGAAVNPA
jgi:hypothetical protein